MIKTATSGLSALSGLFASSLAMAGDLQLPPEVTPALRAACEADVRRLCISANPTIAKVKICVSSRFSELGKRCQIQIALAGLQR